MKNNICKVLLIFLLGGTSLAQSNNINKNSTVALTNVPGMPLKQPELIIFIANHRVPPMSGLPGEGVFISLPLFFLNNN